MKGPDTTKGRGLIAEASRNSSRRGRTRDSGFKKGAEFKSLHCPRPMNHPVQFEKLKSDLSADVP